MHSSYVPCMKKRENSEKEEEEREKKKRKIKMFTKLEAVSFLETSWGLEEVEQRLGDSSRRKALVDEVVSMIQDKVPFQSIKLMSVPLDQRKRPSMETIKQDCMEGVGGLCYSLNVFTWGLLKGLGFSAHLCSSTCFSTVTSPNNHIIVIIKDLEKTGDLHLVDCGSGFPTFRAVSLNFEDESPVFVDSFSEYKYIRHEGQILRMNGEGDRVKRNNPPVEGLDLIMGKWRRFNSFTLQLTDCLSSFDAYFDKVYTDPSASPFHLSPRALHFPGKKAVIIVNSRQMIEQDGGNLETTDFGGDSDKLLQSYHHLFPALKAVVQQAIDHWNSLPK